MRHILLPLDARNIQHLSKDGIVPPKHTALATEKFTMNEGQEGVTRFGEEEGSETSNFRDIKAFSMAVLRTAAFGNSAKNMREERAFFGEAHNDISNHTRTPLLSLT